MDNSFYKKFYGREEYFLSDRVEGYDEYKSGSVSHLKKVEIDLLELSPGERFLDIGCGRGEVASYALNLTDYVTAIDISEPAVKLAHRLCSGRANIIRSFASELPFVDNSFDKILIGDIIEHLTYNDSCKLLSEIRRILRPDGTLLVHTSPNANFMKMVYPLAYLAVKILRPRMAEEIKGQVAESKLDHLNEYSPGRLLKQCNETGFRCSFRWTMGLLRDSQNRLTAGMSDSCLFRMIDRLSKLPVLRNFLVNDLFLICKHQN